MNLENMIAQFRYERFSVRETVRRMGLAKMVGQNIESDLPKYLKVSMNPWIPAVSIKPVDDDATADLFERSVRKISRLLGKPSININNSKLEATWYTHPQFDRNTFDSIMVDLTFRNTEACEIEYVDEIVKRPRLTGYCAKLKHMYDESNHALEYNR